jgi:hypothetical protein
MQIKERRRGTGEEVCEGKEALEINKRGRDRFGLIKQNTKGSFYDDLGLLD